jgi:Vps16, N-terminal region
MEVPHPTAGWEQVGERFYRKTQLYTQIFDQDLDLDNYIVAGAAYGGAIGVCLFSFVSLCRDVKSRFALFLFFSSLLFLSDSL